MSGAAAQPEAICGWGRYPRAQAKVARPQTFAQCAAAVAGAGSVIARGLGRSYGDSSLNGEVIDTCGLKYLRNFETATGLLSCAAGVSLDEILRVFVPRGWFLPVTPGTRFVTVGGAVACDVHGKNHHGVGSFTDRLERIEVLLGSGERVVASRRENSELFRATCGGMGLTGVVLGADFKLLPISTSRIRATYVPFANLDEALAAFAEHAGATYSVAWLDCMARGPSLGRGVLQLGERAAGDELTIADLTDPVPVLVDMPAALLNRLTVSAFNALYYRLAGRARTRVVSGRSFFYPLDALGAWNRLYGGRGFCQYQFVLPLKASAAGLQAVLELVAASGLGSFLAVLKRLGAGNDNYLSFPMEGFTLALDFKRTPAALALMDELDKLVLAGGGRLYLAKDARASEEAFKAGYPEWEQFEQVRASWHAHGKFASAQSRRLGLQ